MTKVDAKRSEVINSFFSLEEPTDIMHNPISY